MKINANIPALFAVRHMNKTNDKIAKSLEKLSSGYKINNVSDDPTGTAVATKIKAQLYGLKLAERNSLDGVSLVQTAEGAMSEGHEMLKRMRELAVQATNETNTPEDRKKIQMEIDQLIESIDQMADVTEFNQMKLLNGSLSNLTTISMGDSISRDLSVKYMSPDFPVGEYTLSVVSSFSCAKIDGTYSAGAGSITLNDDSVDILPTDTDDDIQAKIKELAERYDCAVSFYGANSFTIMSKEAGGDISLQMSGTNVAAAPPGSLASSGTDAVIGEPLSNYGFSPAATYKVEGNRIIITESGGAQIQIDINNQAIGGNTYTVEIEDKGQLKLQTGANEDQRVSLMIPGLSSYALGLSKQSFALKFTNATTGSPEGGSVNLVNVKNTDSSERSIDLLDDAISKLSEMRATLGAYQNRLEHTVRSLEINGTNTEESLSRIQDTDMALEMSGYTLNNVILQSAIAMLSQANERPQQLLQLLR